MIVTGGRFRLVGVLVTLALLARINTSTASSDPKLGVPSSIENARDDTEIKKETSNLEKQKLIRVPLQYWNPRNRERRSIGTADRSEFDGNALNEKSSRDDGVFRNEFKKNYEKFKLARIQAGYNNPSQDLEKYTDTYSTKRSIARRRVGYIVKEDSDDSQNQMNEKYAKRNLAIRDDDYYAQRRSVMERFYARQREIANKYRNKTSTTSEHNDRFDLGLTIRTNNVSSFDKIEKENIFKPLSAASNVNDKINAREYVNNATEPEMHPRRVRTENNSRRNRAPKDAGNNEEEYEYYDEYEDDISNSTNNIDNRILESANVAPSDSKNNSNSLNDNESNSNTLNGNILHDNESNSNTLNDRNATTVVDKNNSTNWGNCKARGVGKLLYQYNTLLRAHKSKADIGVSVDGPFCISCVEVTPSVGTKAIISHEVIRAENGGLQTVKITIRGLQDESLSLTVKIWAVPRTSQGCTGN